MALSPIAIVRIFNSHTVIQTRHIIISLLHITQVSIAQLHLRLLHSIHTIRHLNCDSRLTVGHRSVETDLLLLLLLLSQLAPNL